MRKEGLRTDALTVRKRQIGYACLPVRNESIAMLASAEYMPLS